MLYVVDSRSVGYQLVKGVGHCDVRHNGYREFRAGIFGANLRGFSLGADRRHHLITPFEQKLEDVGYGNLSMLDVGCVG